MQRNRRQASDVEFTLAEIQTAADYDNMCFTCSNILVGVGGSLQKYATYETGYIETAVKVTKNYLGPRIEYLVAAGIMKIHSGETALESVDGQQSGAQKNNQQKNGTQQNSHQQVKRLCHFQENCWNKNCGFLHKDFRLATQFLENY